jgi:50S ribosomal protein L16 3-hydroxylase
MMPELSTLLGGLTPEHFLAEYWQKKPLLVRGAVPEISQLMSRDELFHLATDEDIESRLITRADGWQIHHGPFSLRQIKRATLPWTVLVQSVNLAHATGDALLRRFDFIPYARLDDLMVSYATDSGGVGPHFDNYDVFLIQGMGSRRWHIGKQKDKTLIDGLPIRIIKDFRPTQEWLLHPGDMLYLPPQWAHDGVAVGECMTFSVGFRAPTAQELGEQFLSYLQERLSLPGRYSDPDLKMPRHPAEISSAMVDQVERMLSGIRWNRTTVRDFLGASLTEPKANVFFNPPTHPLPKARFAAAIKRKGVTLAPASQLLFSGKQFYLNGEYWKIPAHIKPLIRDLANHRSLKITQSRNTSLTPQVIDDAIGLFYEAYCNGFLWPAP